MEITNEVFSLRSWVVGPIQTSVYVLACQKTNKAVIIDAGAQSEILLDAIEENQWDLEAIWLTHAHIDHVAGLNEVRAKSDAPIFMHSAGQPVYNAAVQQGALFGFSIRPLPPIDEYVEEGQVVNVGELEAEILFLPGHSPGSIAYYFKRENLFFGGDVLFAGSIGRVDLPGSDPRAMQQSLQRVKKLPDDTIVFPGHGPQTTIGEEKKFNPFLRE